MQTFALVDLVKNLANLARVMLRLHFNGLRFTHKLRCEFGNALGVGGREQQGLSVFRTLIHQLRNIVKEAHIEHAIGFVQHQGFNRLQLQGSTF